MGSAKLLLRKRRQAFIERQRPVSPEFDHSRHFLAPKHLAHLFKRSTGKNLPIGKKGNTHHLILGQAELLRETMLSLDDYTDAPRKLRLRDPPVIPVCDTSTPPSSPAAPNGHWDSLSSDAQSDEVLSSTGSGSGSDDSELTMHLSDSDGGLSDAVGIETEVC